MQFRRWACGDNMTDTTTIQITTEQKSELDELGEASYKAALQTLIDNYSGPIGDGIDETRIRELAREEIRDAVVREALDGDAVDAKTDAEGLECGECGRPIERGEWNTLRKDGSRRCWDCERRPDGDAPGVLFGDRGAEDADDHAGV